MQAALDTRCTAFAGQHRIASGELRHVALVAQRAQGGAAPVLIFDDRSSQPIDIDLRGTPADLLKRLADVSEQIGRAADPAVAEAAPRKGPGRPRLGVVAREVTLLPRHWQWLATQPGGASVALRKLVEEARREHAGSDRKREAQESTYRFMTALAGNEPGFEEATRALFAGDAIAFEERIATWPADVHEHIAMLAADALA
ncbi:hypothetical protein IP90_03039 [Luteimonas cucumeris]|uniref:DUF2239 family protein n=1 Tax=Luteimonas cucumeris TaxID=985012 RepID=A0A562KWF1_9GAMM|nr:DUF2239 family protein [Luteimonas cucumeris]TWH99731.1 hypothetical protein IP90_03039 [Luteimonas cucumeris]